MRKKKFTVGVTFFTTPEMYELIRNIADQREISQSLFLRTAVERYLSALPEQKASDESGQ